MSEKPTPAAKPTLSLPISAPLPPPPRKVSVVTTSTRNLTPEKRRELFARIAGFNLPVNDESGRNPTPDPGHPSEDQGSTGGTEGSKATGEEGEKTSEETGPDGGAGSGEQGSEGDKESSTSPPTRVKPWYCRITTKLGDEILEVNTSSVRANVLGRVDRLQEEKKDCFEAAVADLLESLSEFEELVDSFRPPKAVVHEILHPGQVGVLLSSIRTRVLDRTTSEGPGEETTFPLPEEDTEVARACSDFVTATVPTHCNDTLVNLVPNESTVQPTPNTPAEEVPADAPELNPNEATESDDDLDFFDFSGVRTGSGKEISYAAQSHTVLTVPQKYPEKEKVIRDIGVYECYIIEGGNLGGLCFAIEDEPPAILKYYQLPSFVDLEVKLANGDYVEERLLVDYVADSTVRLVCTKRKLNILNVDVRHELGLAPAVSYDPAEIFFLELAKALGDPEQTQEIYELVRSHGKHIPFVLTPEQKRKAQRRVLQAIERL